jgi:hypothetical protein
MGGIHFHGWHTIAFIPHNHFSYVDSRQQNLFEVLVIFLEHKVILVYIAFLIVTLTIAMFLLLF